MRPSTPGPRDPIPLGTSTTGPEGKHSKMNKAIAAAAAAAILLPGSASPASAAHTPPAPGSLLSIDADHVRLSDKGGTLTLTLSGTSRDLTWFTDRPVHDAGTTSLATLPTLWTAGGPTSFAADPPNAVLTTHDKHGHSQTMVVELANPNYRAKKHRLTFTVKPIQRGGMKAGRTYTDSTLVIDSTSSDFNIAVANDLSQWWSTSTFAITNNTATTFPTGATFTVTLANPPSSSPAVGGSAGAGGPYPSTVTYASGVITAVTGADFAPGGTMILSMGVDGSYSATASSCASTVGSCSVGG